MVNNNKDIVADTPIISICMGEGVVARTPGVIISEGIGSCVVLTLYDTILRIGGMAHIMLPMNRRERAEERRMRAGVIEAKDEERRKTAEDRRRKVQMPRILDPYFVYHFADTAIEELLREMLREGVHTPDVVAKMIGGASMFEYDGDKQPGIGERNISGIRDILKKEGIPVIGKDIGGCHGRSVRFWLNSGRVVVSSIGMEEREI